MIILFTRHKERLGFHSSISLYLNFMERWHKVSDHYREAAHVFVSSGRENRIDSAVSAWCDG